MIGTTLKHTEYMRNETKIDTRLRTTTKKYGKRSAQYKSFKIVFNKHSPEPIEYAAQQKYETREEKSEIISSSDDDIFSLDSNKIFDFGFRILLMK